MSINTTKYEITSELLGESGIQATLSEIAKMVAEWDYTGWSLRVVAMGDQLRVYADRDDSDDSDERIHTEWTQIDRDTCYIIVAEKGMQ
jgi:hypothetical protein